MTPFLKGRRILIVEDEMLVALHLTDLIEELGGTVLGPVGQLEQALSLANSEDLDGALLDVRLGKERSTAVADALLAKNMPVIFSSGYAEGDLPERFAGVPTVPKPVELATLEAVLEKAFGQERQKSST